MSCINQRYFTSDIRTVLDRENIPFEHVRSLLYCKRKQSKWVLNGVQGPGTVESSPHCLLHREPRLDPVPRSKEEWVNTTYIDWTLSQRMYWFLNFPNHEIANQETGLVSLHTFETFFSLSYCLLFYFIFKISTLIWKVYSLVEIMTFSTEIVSSLLQKNPDVNYRGNVKFVFIILFSYFLS